MSLAASESDDWVVDSPQAADTDAETHMAHVAGQLNVALHQLVTTTAAVLESGDWHGHQIQSPTHWLTIHAGLSTSRAKSVVTAAEKVAEFPAVMDKFGRGELSFDRVLVAIKAPAWADADIAGFASVATVNQLRRLIRDQHFDAPPAPHPDAVPEPEPEPAKPSGVGFGFDDDGRFWIRGEGDADGGITIQAALDEARDELFRDGHETVTGWDALVHMATTSLAAASPERRERFKTFIHVDTEGHAQLTNGVVLPDAVRDYMLCDGQVQPVWERDNIPFGVGRTQRIVPDRTRRIVELRDQGCRVPGCGSRHVEVHHIIHWADGGVTETWNLISLCRKHHKQHHQGLFDITGDPDQPDGITFTTGDGRKLAKHPTPIPPQQPLPHPVGEWQHPSGERMDPKWIIWVHPDELTRRRQLARQRGHTTREPDHHQQAS